MLVDPAALVGLAGLGRRGRRALLCLILALAAVLQGQAQLRLQWLGSLHLHAHGGASEQVMAGRGQAPDWSASLIHLLGWVHRWRAELLPDAGAGLLGHSSLEERMARVDPGHVSTPGPQHDHAGLARHHHDRGDATVVALDVPVGELAEAGAQGSAHGGGQGGASAGGSLAALLMRWPAGLATGQPGSAMPGPGHGAARWQDAEIRRAERPPRLLCWPHGQRTA
ncbi:MAG: hypothetical protein RL722_1387 [Pseudomonadota bacterium]|jgi:hypothetical protein